MTAPRRTKKRPLRLSSLKPTRHEATNVAPKGQTALERELQGLLVGILQGKWIRRAQNGVLVIDAKTGDTLFSYGADRQLNPASNVKLVSTAAALDAVGGEFRYRTRILGPAADPVGMIPGDVFLVGNFDPTLRVEDVQGLVQALSAQGIQVIAGDVVVGMNEARDSLGQSRLIVVVRGGEKEGDLPTVVLEPDTALFSVENSARTTSKGRRARLEVGLRVKKNSSGERIVVAAAGRIRPGQVFKMSRTVPRPALHVGYLLRALLLQANIEVRGGVRQENAPPPVLPELAAHESLPLGVLVGKVNKPSWNFLADRVVWTAGAELFGGSPSNEKGLRAMIGFLTRIGIARNSYRLENGSGLSRSNRLSARQIIEVLTTAGRDFRIAPDFLASLSVAGRDGTLKGRFRGHPSAGRFRGKTGTLSGVLALSGFVSIGGEDTLCFAILTNGFKNRRKQHVRSSQAAMVNAMYRYLVKRHLTEEGALETEGLQPPPTPMLDPSSEEGESENDSLADETNDIKEQPGPLDEGVEGMQPPALPILRAF
ncbi:MAG: D-alanyl-D-alanine carboxypeptidase/D-alanyl-D-alanine-endopeptidase [Deltaproteobacteria bacterium]|nr:D-alanyl-D-alanine carboxypeptidase/D-alanyl-D-alanine-endopeptidase [Deltaproteobacteria bacterium]